MLDQPTRILFGEEAIKKILRGIKIGYDAVRLTMGPEGKNALTYGTYGRDNRISNDGFFTLEAIQLEDEFENIGLSVLKNATKKTNGEVGDGTSCTTVLGGKAAINIFRVLSEGHSAIGSSSSVGVMTIRRDLLETARKAEEYIAKPAIKI